MAQGISPQHLVRPGRQSRAGALSRPTAGVDTRRALEGTLALPLFSARTAGRHSITVEFFRTGGVDAVVQAPEHRISVATQDLPRLLQCRDGVSSERRVLAGDIFVTPAGTPKRWSHADAAEYIALRLQPEFLPSLCDSEPASRGTSARLLDNFGTRDPHLQSLAGRLLREVWTTGFGNLMYTEALAIELGIHLLRQYCDADHGGDGRTPEHLGEDLTLGRIAGELAMSPFHFAHAFRQTTGVAPHRYVMDCRIDRAMHLLRETEMPVSEVGQEVGIPSPSHFSLLFRRSTGSTPTRYRAEH
jgi:AraC family transcriptional regulator